MNDVTVVFCSCDGYCDLWENFFFLMKKYWPQFDGEIILNSETGRFHMDGLRISEPLNCIPGTAWSDRLSLSLKRVKTPYVLLMLEDFYLKAPVNHERFMQTLQHMRTHPNVASVTYLREPGVKTVKPELEGFYSRRQFSLYKLTAHITLYRRDYLLEVLRRSETAWEFEVNGTVRSWFKRGSFLCPADNKKPIFSYDYGLLCLRGKYYGPVKQYFETQENLTFSQCRDTIEHLEPSSGGKFLKKVRYLRKGLLSVFKERAL